MKALSFFIAVIISIFLIQSDLLSQYGWFQQTSGTTQTLNSISVVNENTVYVCGGSGVILRTTNGGTNWVQQSSGYSYNLSDTYFIDSQTGWACGGFSNYPNIGIFSVLKTTNGGASWIVILNLYSMPGNNSPMFNNVYFVNALSGFITVSTSPGGIVSSGYLYFTTDGGANWQLTNPLRSNGGITFLNSTTGFLLSSYGDDTGHDTAYFYKTTDLGSNWNMMSQYSGFGFNDCTFINENTGWIAGKRRSSGASFNGVVFKTTNSGLNWDYTTIISTISVNSVSFPSIDTGYICGPGVYRTTDAGSYWNQQLNPVIMGIKKIRMVNSLTGWCVGSSGLILKTNTGGIDAIYKISEPVPEKFSLNQNYPNPFNPSTKIRFSIPNSSQHVRIIIYDVLGNKISEPVNKKLDAGTYETEWDATNYASSVYYYRLVVGYASASSFDPAHDGLSTGYIETKKMILVK